MSNATTTIRITNFETAISYLVANSDDFKPSAKVAGAILVKAVCSRCHGSGHYSYNQIDGTKCFGCMRITPTGAKINQPTWTERVDAVTYARKLKSKRAAQARREAKRAAQAIEAAERQAKQDAARKLIEDAREAKRLAIAEKSSFVGQIKERLQLTLTITFTTSFETMYGTSFLYNMVDDQGNVFVWFSSVAIRADKGDVWTLKGTVKEHKIYRDTKQTVLTRCKVEGK